MNDWTAGYVADIGYTYGYYAELNPLRTKLAFLNSGLNAPVMGIACELGFGQGVSTNLHAAASTTHWCGTDFNPAQASFAQELATISGAHVKLHDDAFADFAMRADLPDFDFIGIHGIWSWISDQNRIILVDFIRRKLKVGGVLYISYNTQPGLAAFAPMRHLMTQHAEVIGSEGHGIISRIDGALNFTEKLLATNPGYLKANPQIIERIKRVKEQNRHYLAHEYFNRDWHPMHFATIAECLAPAKVSFACSAHYLDHVGAINLTAEQQDFLKEIPDAMFRETVRDFMTNQQFRRDYWVKGARHLNLLEQAEQLKAQRIMLVKPRSQISLKVTGALGEANLNEAIYPPILEVMADQKPRTLGDLGQAVRGSNINFAQLVQAIMILVGSGHMAAVQEDAIVNKAKKQTDKLNSCIIEKARGSNELSYLASPVTGGGVTVNRIQQLFLLAIGQGRRQPTEWAAVVWAILDAQGQKILKEGKALETPEENLAELTDQAAAFAKDELPLLRALHIC